MRTTSEDVQINGDGELGRMSEAFPRPMVSSGVAMLFERDHVLERHAFNAIGHGEMAGSEVALLTPANSLQGEGDGYPEFLSGADFNEWDAGEPVKATERPRGRSRTGGITIVNHSYVVKAGHMLRVAAPGVLAGACEGSGQRLVARMHVAGVMPGAVLDLREDGSFVYAPAEGFVGVDCFAFRAKSGNCRRTGYVSIKVQ